MSRNGSNVRAPVHDGAKSRTVREQGAEVFVDDLDGPGHPREAASGADRIYLLTTNGPNSTQQASRVVSAAKASGSTHIVRQSGYGSPKSRIIKQHIEAETEIRSSGLPCTLFRPTFYMQNTMMAAQTVASQGVIYMPFGEGRVGMIDARDIEDVAAAVLTGTGHEGKEYTLTGPASISFRDVSDILTDVLGRAVSYTDVPIDAGRQSMLAMGFPEWIADGYLELTAEFAQNRADRTTNDVQHITGAAPRSFREFASDFAPAFGGARSS